jgi:Iap family predicted aminopeptidase
MVAAVVVMVATNQDLAERVQIMEAVTDIYEAKVATLEACERGAVGYYYAESKKTFECSKPL